MSFTHHTRRSTNTAPVSISSQEGQQMKPQPTQPENNDAQCVNTSMSAPLSLIKQAPHFAQPRPTRRAFLRGLGASLALPWLETTHAPVWAQQGAAPHRFLAFYTPNGFNMSQFWPATTGALSAQALGGTSLSTLGPWAQQLLMINGLDNHAASAQGDGPGDHARGTSTMLTCAHPLKSPDQLSIGVSVDQLIAQHWAGQTSINSLELGCEGGGNAGSCDSGYSCAYSRNISWADAQTPLPKEVNPRLLFNRLFGNLDPNLSPEAVAQRRRRRQSVLDFVSEDARALLTEVSVSDRQRIDAYLTGVREVERRLQATEDSQCEPSFDAPSGVPSDRAEHAHLLLDLLVAAFRCDLTRVSSFMLGNGGSNRPYPEVGVAEGHHTLSHHQQDANTLSKVATIDRWSAGIFTHLLDRLSSTEEAGVSLLDHTTVLWTSECADGNAHRHYDMPVILAGRAANFTMGQYVNLSAPEQNNAPLANLYLSILQDAGVLNPTFGDDGVQPLDLSGT